MIVLSEYFPSIFRLVMVDAPDARSALENVGGKDFDIVEFERRFGVDLSPEYPMLVQMKGLLDLEEPAAPERPSVADEAQSVFLYSA